MPPHRRSTPSRPHAPRRSETGIAKTPLVAPAEDGFLVITVELSGDPLVEASIPVGPDRICARNRCRRDPLAPPHLSRSYQSRPRLPNTRRPGPPWNLDMAHARRVPAACRLRVGVRHLSPSPSSGPRRHPLPGRRENAARGSLSRFRGTGDCLPCSVQRGDRGRVVSADWWTLTHGYPKGRAANAAIPGHPADEESSESTFRHTSTQVWHANIAETNHWRT